MERIELGQLDALRRAGPSIFIYPKGPAPWRSILILPSDDGIIAFWNVCQHLPLPLDGGTFVVPFEGEDLVCGTHGARFRTRDGLCTEGPCEGEALVRVPLEIEGGVVYGRVSQSGGPLNLA